MLSWLFGSPWMLAWLPLAAAPILIHLWYRRKYRPMTWAAMEYLLAAIARSSRRMRIEQLLLLLLRIAAVLLAVLALAEPLMPSGAAQLLSGTRTHHVLVMDGSYSMGYKVAAKTLFDQARLRARQVVDGAGEGDAFTLVLMGDTPRVVIGHAAFDPGAVTREIESLAPAEGGANVSAALAAAERLVRDVAKQNQQLSRHRVYFFTDLQRTSWGAESRTSEAETQFRKRAERLGADGSLEVVALGGGAENNLVVERLSAVDAYATTAQPVHVQVVLRNYGSQPLTGQVVELLADNHPVEQKKIDVPAGEAAPQLSFSYRFESPGDHVLSVRAEGDALAIDNQRFLALSVKDHLRALCVSGKSDSTKFLVPALDPDYREESRSIIRPQVVAESALMDLDLKQFDCIFLADVGQFTSSEARVLESYLKAGGGLVFFLGDQVVADSYNRELTGQAPGSVHVLPAMLGEAKYNEKYFHLDPLGYRHPLMHMWKANPQAGLLSAPVAKYFQLKLPEKSSAQVALAFDNGDPAIVEESIQRGRCILVATAASTDSVVDAQSRRPWTLMPTSPSFPPLVQGLWRLAVAGKIQQHNSEVGQPLGGLLPPLKTGANPVVIPPGRQQEKPLTVSEADAGRWTYVDTDYSGIYTVNIPGDNATQQKFAVNVDTREGNLARIGMEDLPREFLQDGKTHNAATSTTTVAVAPRRFPLHQVLLCVVLTLLLTESIVAWWLGNRTA